MEIDFLQPNLGSCHQMVVAYQLLSPVCTIHCKTANPGAENIKH